MGWGTGPEKQESRPHGAKGSRKEGVLDLLGRGTAGTKAQGPIRSETQVISVVQKAEEGKGWGCAREPGLTSEARRSCRRVLGGMETARSHACGRRCGRRFTGRQERTARSSLVCWWEGRRSSRCESYVCGPHRSEHSTPRLKPKTENRCSTKNLDVNVHSGAIGGNQKARTTQKSVRSLYNGMPFG